MQLTFPVTPDIEFFVSATAGFSPEIENQPPDKGNFYDFLLSRTIISIMFEVTSRKAITTAIKIFARPYPFFFFRMSNKNSTSEVVFADPKAFLKC